MPRRACTQPPNGFITALAARSLETAATGGTPKTRTRMGVISAPPPMPVKPDDDADAESGERQGQIHRAILGEIPFLVY